MKKTITTVLMLILIALSVIMVESVYAEQSLPEFTLRYVDKSYDVAPTTTSSTDPYTGNITTTTILGYHVSYETIEVTIENNLGASYYGLRYKGHYSDVWTYFPYGGPDSHNIYDDFFPPNFQASSSSYTVDYLPLHLLPQPIPQGAPIDVQVQPLFGNFDVTPYVHVQPVGGPTYDAIFKGTVGDWSNTQTIPLPSPPSTLAPPKTYYSVPPLSSLSLKINLGHGYPCSLLVYIKGGSGNDINLRIINPEGKIIYDLGRISNETSFKFYADQRGDFTIILDNEFSVFSSKEVNVFQGNITFSNFELTGLSINFWAIILVAILVVALLTFVVWLSRRRKE